MKSPTEQEDEAEASDKGTEAPEGDSGVDVSEDYQSQAHQVTHKASKHEIRHLRGKMNDREDALREEEEAEKNTKGAKMPKGVPETYSSARMPE